MQHSNFGMLKPKIYREEVVQAPNAILRNNANGPYRQAKQQMSDAMYCHTFLLGDGGEVQHHIQRQLKIKIVR